MPDLKPEKWHDAVPDLKLEESAHVFGDLEEVADFEEESYHAFVEIGRASCRERV